ncbi:MAG: hypothetical protein ACQETI_08285 [Halobacteriota archaeon]
MSEEEASNRPTMADVAHTHPYTGETFGQVYRRGPVVADGGEEPAMVDVDHTPPHGDGTNDVWARGDEHAVETDGTPSVRTGGHDGVGDE